MKTTIVLPDDVHRAVQQRAERGGRPLVEEIIQLVKLGLLSRGASPAEIDEILRNKIRIQRVGSPSDLPESTPITTDPATRLPLVKSPPDALIHSMTVAEALALEQQSELEDDLERAGLPIRH